MSTKQLETISGAVEQLNDKGIKLLGEWANFSMYHPVPRPAVGQLVDVQIERSDRGAWITSLRILEGTSAAASPSTNRDRVITRLAVLKAAAIFAGHKATVIENVTSADVLKIADSWLAWVEDAS